ncbi:hypothetical protein CCP3SC1_1670004 [Gammaproteobacteria bacterium]
MGVTIPKGGAVAPRYFAGGQWMVFQTWMDYLNQGEVERRGGVPDLDMASNVP